MMSAKPSTSSVFCLQVFCLAANRPLLRHLLQQNPWPNPAHPRPHHPSSGIFPQSQISNFKHPIHHPPHPRASEAIRPRPKPNMAGTRNPFGRRPHPGSRIHLTSRQPAYRKTVAKRNLGKAVWRATLTANENRRESFRYRQISASSGAFFLSAFQFSAFQHFSFTQIPLFPRNPHFPPSSLRRLLR
jgi:hypothetical protein